MKKLIIVATAAVFAMGLGLTTAMAVDPPSEDIAVTNFGKKDVVKFSHAKHAGQDGVECATCHHKATGDAAADVANYKCGNCHKEEDGDAPKLKDAAHGADVGRCWKCHFAKSPDLKKELKCKSCHVGN